MSNADKNEHWKIYRQFNKLKTILEELKQNKCHWKITNNRDERNNKKQKRNRKRCITGAREKFKFCSNKKTEFREDQIILHKNHD